MIYRAVHHQGPHSRHHGSVLIARLVAGWSGRLVVITVLICFLILFGTIIMNPPSCHISGPKEWISTDGLRSFAIRTTWDGGCVDHEPIKLSLGPGANGGLKLKVLAPFFNDPTVPSGIPGQPFDGLWDYEVVEAFFLNDNDQYLEVELSPHGQHLVLMLKGRRDMVKDKLPLSFNATISNDRWYGEALIPRSYFPPGVTKFNAYAIHGEGDGRVYEALYPVVGSFDQPDFHRLEFFQPLDMSKILDHYDSNEVSDLWKPYVASQV